MTDYASLHQIIRSLGLLERSRPYYLVNLLFVVGLYSIVVGLALNIPPSLLSIVLISLVWTFASVQTGALGHDANHYQIFSSKRYNDLVAFLCWNMGLGISNKWWQDQHNDHHFFPNDVNRDPSIDISLMSFSEEQWNKRGSLQRFFIRYQHYLYFPMMTFGVIHLRVSGIIFILRNKKDDYITELGGIVFHLILYSVFIFSILGFKYGLLLMTLHHALQGIYIGIIFAPNHKGMPVITSDFKVDPMLQQIITSRNIKGGSIISFFYGGLNYQIEHHLFTNMPRNNLKRAKPIVEQFCRSQQISYHETSTHSEK